MTTDPAQFSWAQRAASARPPAPSSGRSLSAPRVALLFSLLVHASVAAAAFHGSSAASASRAPLVTAPELNVTDVSIVEGPASRRSPFQPVAAAPAEISAAAPRSLSARSALPAVGVAPSAVGVAPSAVESSSAPAELQGTAVSGVPHFAMVVAATVGPTSTTTQSGGVSAVGAHAAAAFAGPIAAALADVPARLRSGDAPRYTAAALTAGVEANVVLEIVVDGSGAVTSAHGLEHVGYGLDEVALRSVLAYRFAPALRGGSPVSVRMRWVMRFQFS